MILLVIKGSKISVSIYFNIHVQTYNCVHFLLFPFWQHMFITSLVLSLLFFVNTHYNVIGLLCNNKDAVACTTLLTACIQVCFCLNMFWTCTAYDYSLYIQLAHLWAWLFTLAYIWPYWSALLYTHVHSHKYKPVGG